MRQRPLRPSERFAIKVLREDGQGEASDRAWLISMMQYRSRRWRKSTYQRALQVLWHLGFVVRWQAGPKAFYKLSLKGQRTGF